VSDKRLLRLLRLRHFLFCAEWFTLWMFSDGRFAHFLFAENN